MPLALEEVRAEEVRVALVPRYCPLPSLAHPDALEVTAKEGTGSPPRGVTGAGPFFRPPWREDGPGLFRWPPVSTAC